MELKKCSKNFSFAEATIGFSEASYDVVEGVGKARVWVGFTAGEALVPVTVG